VDRGVGAVDHRDVGHQVNEGGKRAMGRKVLDALGGMETARGRKVALLGLTFSRKGRPRGGPSVFANCVPLRR
ncbi:hypothetical protein, partial [Tsuneonella sp. HG222]